MREGGERILPARLAPEGPAAGGGREEPGGEAPPAEPGQESHQNNRTEQSDDVYNAKPQLSKGEAQVADQYLD